LKKEACLKVVDGKEQFNEVSSINKKNLNIKYNLLKKIYSSDSNIQVLDLVNYLPRENLNEIYYDDVHLTKMGHQFIAELIYSIIKKIN
jgi:lysophospholipase L1-like esterase